MLSVYIEMHYTNNILLFHNKSNGILISIINDKWQCSIGELVLGDDKLVDAQVSGCQGGLFGCHPSCFCPGLLHYSPCEMPLYIARYCEHRELNNATHNHIRPAALPTIQRASCSARARSCEGQDYMGSISCCSADQNRSRVTLYFREVGAM